MGILHICVVIEQMGWGLHGIYFPCKFLTMHRMHREGTSVHREDTSILCILDVHVVLLFVFARHVGWRGAYHHHPIPKNWPLRHASQSEIKTSVWLSMLGYNLASTFPWASSHMSWGSCVAHLLGQVAHIHASPELARFKSLLAQEGCFVSSSNVLL